MPESSGAGVTPNIKKCQPSGRKEGNQPRVPGPPSAVPRRIVTRLRELGDTEVKNLHTPVGRDDRLSGFKSRWTMFFACTAASPSAIWHA